MTCSKCSPDFGQRTRLGSPEITRLLRSQCALTPVQTAQVFRCLLDAEADLDDIDTQISALRSMITSLSVTRKVIEKEAERFRSCFAPVRKLPTEILNYILVFSAERNVFGGLDWRFRALSASLVCKRWRDVALACPQLWSTLRVFIYDHPRHEEICAATEMCLTRSAQAPLDLHICIDNSPKLERFVPLFQSIVRHSKRWRNVKLKGSSNAYVSDSLSSARFTSLERVELDSALRLAVFQSVPKLSSLCLRHSARPEDNIGFPWFQIRTLHLEINNSSHDSLYELLPICSGVEHLRYMLTTYNMPAIPAIPSQKSMTVRSLSIEVSDLTGFNNFTILLQSLELPSVRSVSLRSAFLDGNTTITEMRWHQDAFVSFFTRSERSITTLDLVDIPVDTEQLTSILLLTPALESLTVRQTISTGVTHYPTKSKLDMDFIQHLYVYAASSSPQLEPLVSRLNSLTLHATEDWFDDGALFVNVVQSRWIPEHASSSALGVDCLRSVELYLLEGELDEDVYEPLRTLEKAGLKLRLRGME